MAVSRTRGQRVTSLFMGLLTVVLGVLAVTSTGWPTWVGTVILMAGVLWAGSSFWRVVERRDPTTRSDLTPDTPTPRRSPP